MAYRIGSGVDYHRLTEGRELWIGGVLIPHTRGALGHSDADVLLHAVCDALLGSLGLGDIGTHFPDTDPAYKNIDSKLLLKQTMQLIAQENYVVVNIDCTVCLEAPKIKPWSGKMRETIASLTGLTPKDISIKATTTEQMGFVGREEGLMAFATVLVREKDPK